MKFSENLLVVDEREISNLDIFSDKSEDQYDFKETTYVINCEIIDNSVFWLYARYGKEKPYSDEVLNSKTKEYGKNPKQQSDIELKDQFFCAFVLSTKILYMSDYRKQTFLRHYLHSRFDREFLVKKYFVNPEEFVKEITSVQEIQFVSQKRDVLSSGIFGEIDDILGYGMTSCFTVEAKMDKKGKFVPEKTLELIYSFQRRRDNGEIKRMRCKGKDDKAVEKIFNLDNLINKFELNLEKDENGMYDEELVKQEFLKKISEDLEC